MAAQVVSPFDPFTDLLDLDLCRQHDHLGPDIVASSPFSPLSGGENRNREATATRPRSTLSILAQSIAVFARGVLFPGALIGLPPNDPGPLPASIGHAWGPPLAPSSSSVFDEPTPNG